MATIDQVEIVGGPTEIIMIEVSSPGNPGTGVTAADWNALVAQSAANTAKLASLKTTDLVDTALPPRSDGYVMYWDATANLWKSRSMNEAVRYIKNGTAVVLEHADRLAAGAGLIASQNGGIATQADFAVDFAGTGAANTVARSDHTHSPVVFADFDFAATGNLSSGTRTLVSTSLTGLDPTKSYFITADFEFRMRNAINAGTVNASIRLGASGTYPAKVKNLRAVGGVDSQSFIRHQRPVSGASSIQITATVAFDTGDAMDIRAGTVYVAAIPTS